MEEGGVEGLNEKQMDEGKAMKMEKMEEKEEEEEEAEEEE